MGAVAVPLVLLFISASLLPPLTRALVFHLPSGRVKCITEDLRAAAISSAHYRLADEPPIHGRKISAQVTDPNGEVAHRAEGVESGEFAFVAAKAGQYTACFWSPKFELSATIAVDLEWRTGIAAKQWPSVAKKTNIEGMELELKILEDFINSIHEEMLILRKQEEAAWRFNEETNSRMGLLSLFSLIICLTVAGLQLFHLRAFFTRRKIL